jgi:hypothetical protein
LLASWITQEKNRREAGGKQAEVLGIQGLLCNPLAIVESQYNAAETLQ